MFKLKTSRKRSFVGEVDGKEYSAPTAGELPTRWMDRLIGAYSIENEDERGKAIWHFMYDLFCEYVGEDIVGDMNSDEFGALCDAWNAETEDADGATPGE